MDPIDVLSLLTHEPSHSAVTATGGIWGPKTHWRGPANPLTRTLLSTEPPALSGSEPCAGPFIIPHESSILLGLVTFPVIIWLFNGSVSRCPLQASSSCVWNAHLRIPSCLVGSNVRTIYISTPPKVTQLSSNLVHVKLSSLRNGPLLILINVHSNVLWLKRGKRIVC